MLDHTPVLSMFEFYRFSKVIPEIKHDRSSLFISFYYEASFNPTLVGDMFVESTRAFILLNILIINE